MLLSLVNIFVIDIYYESHPYIVNIQYKNVNETQQHLICLNSQRVVHMYTIISTLEDVENLLYSLCVKHVGFVNKSDCSTENPSSTVI